MHKGQCRGERYSRTVTFAGLGATEGWRLRFGARGRHTPLFANITGGQLVEVDIEHRRAQAPHHGVSAAHPWPMGARARSRRVASDLSVQGDAQGVNHVDTGWAVDRTQRRPHLRAQRFRCRHQVHLSDESWHGPATLPDHSVALINVQCTSWRGTRRFLRRILRGRSRIPSPLRRVRPHRR